jgi:hypothetical protein
MSFQLVSELGMVKQAFHLGLPKDQSNHCSRINRWDLKEGKGVNKGT